MRVGWAGSAVGEEALEGRTQGRERRELLLPPLPPKAGQECGQRPQPTWQAWEVAG